MRELSSYWHALYPRYTHSDQKRALWSIQNEVREAHNEENQNGQISPERYFHSEDISTQQHYQCPTSNSELVSGRIASIRFSSNKLVFFDLFEGGCIVQVKSSLASSGLPDSAQAVFKRYFQLLQRGDYISNLSSEEIAWRTLITSSRQSERSVRIS
jgi:hypothetical protein